MSLVKFILQFPINFFKKYMPDSLYLALLYKRYIGKYLNLQNPQTFNAKLQWLKLHDRNPLYTILVDKYAVKEWVAERIGKEHIIPTLGVWDRFDEIDFSKLPDQFVLKCTHDSGGVVVVTDKKAFLADDESKGQKGITKARKKLTVNLKKNFYYLGREWPYKNVKPRIIAEKYMVDESGIELKDYKVHVFDGEPKLIQVDYGRFTEHKRNLYDTEWTFVDAQIQYQKDANHIIDKTKVLKQMLECSKFLAQGIPYVRTDFYCIDDKLLFGEMTFYHGSGFEKIVPEEFEKILGNWIDLSCVSIDRNGRGCDNSYISSFDLRNIKNWKYKEAA